MSLTGYFYRLAYPFLQIYWFLFRPHTAGVRCLIKYQDKFLFIKNTYNSQWNIPGGGLHKNETPLQAVVREIQEEVGINLPSPQLLGQYISTEEYKVDTVYCFFSQISSSKITLDPAEILEAQWLTLSGIPHPCNSGVDKIIKLYHTKINK